MSLEDFRRALIKDPLFAAEGMDIENAARAIDSIESRADSITKACASGSWIRALIAARYPARNNAYPVRWLRAFLEAETERRRFVAEPSLDRAHMLLASWRTALLEYRSAITRYRKLHFILGEFEWRRYPSGVPDLFGRVLGRSDIGRMFELLQKNGDVLSACIEDREILLRRSGSFEAPHAPDTVVSEGEIHPEFARLHELEKKAGVAPFRHAEILAAYGPYALKMTQFDGSAREHAFLIYEMREHNGVKSAWVAALDRFLFTDISQERAASNVQFVYSGGHKKGEVRLWYEPAGHLYATHDPRYWVELCERAISDTRGIPSKAALAQRSTSFDRVLGAVALDMLWYGRHMHRRARSSSLDTYSFLYGLLMRTFPGLLFLTFNRSVYRLAEDILPPLACEKVGSYVAEEEIFALLDTELSTIFGAQRTREEQERASGVLDE